MMAKIIEVTPAESFTDANDPSVNVKLVFNHKAYTCQCFASEFPLPLLDSVLLNRKVSVCHASQNGEEVVRVIPWEFQPSRVQLFVSKVILQAVSDTDGVFYDYRISIAPNDEYKNRQRLEEIFKLDVDDESNGESS